MKENSRVIRNLLLVVSSEGVGGILNFAIVLLSARLLGVEIFGVFSYILAITGVCQLIADFGLTSLIVREVAKHKDRAHYIMSNVMSLAWLLSALIFMVVIVVAHFTLEQKHEWIAAIIMGIAVLATYHTVVFSSVCRAFERMGYNAFSFVVHKVILLGLVLYFAGESSPFESNLIGLAVSYAIANAIQYLFFVVVVRTRFVKFGFGKDVSFCLKLLAEAIPIGASMVIRRMTLHVDVILLTSLSSAVAVGIFTSAYKVVQMVDMIPHALCLPLFPALARLAAGDRKGLESFLNAALIGFIIFALPISGYLFVSSDNLITLLYGDDFATAAPVLKVLAFTAVALFVNMLLSYLFVALNKQRFYLLSAGACLAVTFLIDLALIPSMQEMGAAYGTLIGEFTYLILCVFFLKSLGFNFSWLANTWRPLLLTALAVIACSTLQSTGMEWQIIATFVFAVIYLPGLFVLRVVRVDDLRHVVDAIKPGAQKVPTPSTNAISGTK